MVPVRATGEGLVEGVPPGPNTGIKRGAQLLQIESSSLQGELSLAVAALSAALNRANSAWSAAT